MWSFFSSDPSKSFPYEVGEKVDGLDGKSLWTLHKGKKKANGDPVSIFAFDIKNSSETVVALAIACFKRVKTMRHPNMVTYLDGLESDKMLYIVTEPVAPLTLYLQSKAANPLAISWGLFCVSKALSFMVNDCSMIHNNVCIWSVYVNRAGDWLLGGMEFSSKVDGQNAPSIIKTLPDLEKYDPPEKLQSVVRGAKWAVDSWGLGCLIWEAFNGPLSRSSSLKALNKIPKSLVSSYCELVGANPKSRPNPSKFIDNCRISGGFMNNTFIDTMLFLDEIQIKDQGEKTAFFQKLSPSLDSFPPEICRHRILPQLINAFEFSNAGSVILAPLLKVGKILDTADFQKMILPCVIKLFSSPDRSTRVKLLQQIETYVEHLPIPAVNDQIFPHIIQGFSDTNPVIREATVKAMTHLASKLNYKNLNEELMKHFARLQTKDDQGGIRTNTTICLGKIAGNINPTIRQKILISAFTRATRDPFGPARQAGIIAMGATQNYYPLKEIALKLLPTLCSLTVDPDKSVREQAFKAIHGFVEKLEKVSEDPSCLEKMESGVMSGGTPADGVAGWAGWAVSGMSSLTSRIYRPKAGSPAKAGGSESTNINTTETKNPKFSSQDKQSTAIDDADAQESYDDWDEGWGDMSSENKDKPSHVDVVTLTAEDHYEADDATNDWDADVDDWGSLETFTHAQSDVSTDYSATPTASSYFTYSNTDSDFFSQIQSDPKASKTPSTKIQQTPQPQTKSLLKNTQGQNIQKQHNIKQTASFDITNTSWEESSWGDGGDWADTDINFEDTENKNISEREAKRQQRQQEIQQKREQRKSNAMKLGTKRT